jgi:hypothetical protein
MNLLEEYHQWLSEGEHWDKVRRNNDTEIQNAQQYAQQMLDQHGDDETVQKLSAAILKLNPNSKEHQDQILDAAEQLNDYVAQQVGHKPKDDKGKKPVKESYEDVLPYAKSLQASDQPEDIQRLARKAMNPKNTEAHDELLDYVKTYKVKRNRRLER